MKIFSASVGKGGRNKPTDVALVQQLLKMANPDNKFDIDGLINNQTIKAIETFQKNVVKLAKPDSRVDVTGKTYNTLIKVTGYKPATNLPSAIGQLRSDRFVALYNKQYTQLGKDSSAGLAYLINEISKDKDVQNIYWAAYMLATTKRETGSTWLPIEEYGKGKTKKYGKKVEVTDKSGKKHKHTYYGRGYVQLTWDFNYKTVSDKLGMGEDLYIHPEKALEKDIAYKIMSYGMRNGIFTGKKLSDYIAGNSVDYYNARRIINGTDKAKLIQGYAESLEQLLRLSKLQPEKKIPVVNCTPIANVCFA